MALWLDGPGGLSVHERGQAHRAAQHQLPGRLRPRPSALIWTRGERFPRDQLESRLRWPKCGQMNVHVMWRCPISRSGMRRPEARKKPLIVKRQSQLD